MNSIEDIMKMIATEAKEGGPLRPEEGVGPFAPDEYEKPDTWVYNTP